MPQTLRLLALFLLLIFPGCGQKPEPKAPDEAAPNLRPAGLPGQLVVDARWPAPGRTVDRLASMAGVMLPWRFFAGQRFPELAAIAWDAPVDVLVILPDAPKGRLPLPRAAVSIGLSSVQAAVNAAERSGLKPRKLSADRYRVLIDRRFDCVFTATKGEAKARAVCGVVSSDVDALLPYLTEVRAREPGSGDKLSVDIYVAPLRERYGNHASALLRAAVSAGLDQVEVFSGTGVSSKQLEPPVNAIAQALSVEARALLDDVDRVHVGADLSGGDGIALDVALKYRSTRSTSLSQLSEQAKRSASTPGILWHCPASSDQVIYLSGFESKSVTPMREHGGSLLAGLLAYRGVTPRLRQDALDLFAGVPLPSGDVVAARGGSGDQSWELYGYKGGADPMKSYALKLVQSLNDPVLGQQLGRLARDLWLPVIPDAARTRPRSEVKSLPPDTLVVELPLKGGAAARSVKLIVASDVPYTWVAAGMDERSLVQALASAQRGAADSATLKGRDGLDFLRDQRALAGGFTSMRALESIPIRRRAELLEGTPNGGRVPLPWRVRLDAANKRLSLEARVPSAALRDVLSLAMSGGFGP